MVRNLETIADDVSLELTLDSNNDEMESPTELSRHRRATNDTSGNNTTTNNDTTTVVTTTVFSGSGSGNSGSGRSAIEEFYADKHNMAMYLILPLIILVYGGCSCTYCVYKCRRYLRKRVVIYQKRKLAKISDNKTHVTRWTAANNEIQFVKSMPNLRESISDPCNRPATSLALCSSIETQEVDQLLEELAIITDDKPVVKTERPVAEVTPVVQVRTKHVNQVQSTIKEEPNESQTPPVVEVKSQTPVVVVEVKSVVKENDSEKEVTLPPRKKKKLILSANDIAEIMKYYNDKKHMPNVIPEDSENDKEINRKLRKKKIFSS